MNQSRPSPYMHSMALSPNAKHPKSKHFCMIFFYDTVNGLTDYRHCTSIQVQKRTHKKRQNSQRKLTAQKKTTQKPKLTENVTQYNCKSAHIAMMYEGVRSTEKTRGKTLTVIRVDTEVDGGNAHLET